MTAKAPAVTGHPDLRPPESDPRYREDGYLRRVMGYWGVPGPPANRDIPAVTTVKAA